MATLPEMDSCAYGPAVAADRPLRPGQEAGEGFFAVETAPPGPRESPDAIALTLSGATEVAVDQPLGLTLSVENTGKAPVVLMRALDGSLWHWRFPTYDIYARDEAGRTHRWAYAGGRCGNVNPITDEDFVQLAPGQSRDDVAGDWANLESVALPEPGRYTLWVVYTMCAELDVKRNETEDELRRKLGAHQVTLGQHRSTPLEVTVDAAP